MLGYAGVGMVSFSFIVQLFLAVYFNGAREQEEVDVCMIGCSDLIGRLVFWTCTCLGAPSTK